MTDIIALKKVNGKVIGKKIIVGMKHDESMIYIRRYYRRATVEDMKKFGFDRELLGTTYGADSCFPLDDSHTYIGCSNEGIIMLLASGGTGWIWNYNEKDPDYQIMYIDKADKWSEKIYLEGLNA